MVSVASFLNTLPGTMMRIGGACDSIYRICTGEVWVRITAPGRSLIQKVSCICRAGWLAGMLSASKLWYSSSSSGPVATVYPNVPNTATNSPMVAAIGVCVALSLRGVPYMYSIVYHAYINWCVVCACWCGVGRAGILVGIYMAIILLENIRSILNVGSVFRTADAVGAERVLLAGYTPAPIDRMGRVNEKLHKTALGAEGGGAVGFVYLRSGGDCRVSGIHAGCGGADT